MNINEQTLLAWIMIDNEQEKEKAANQWLPYLVNAHAAAIWKQLLKENRYTSHKEQIKKSWNLVQRKTVTRLFAFSDVKETEAWCDYASYFLLSLQAVKLSLDIRVSANEIKGGAYFSWGNLFDKHIDKTVGKEEYVEAAIKCYKKAQEFFHMVEGSEKVIASCEAALMNYTREKLAHDPAKIQNDLGSQSIKGDLSADIENTIATCEAALIELTREESPYKWAMTQCNLGHACWKRIQWEKADNLEKAIDAYESALLEFTHENLPYEWAWTKNSLGAAYNIRVKGDRAENIEKAIANYEATLREYTREKLPHDWASTQNNLGIAYSERIKGDMAENLEKAIGYCEAALQERTREKLPYNWAETQNILADTYRKRIKGNKAENVEHAITALQLALLVFIREKFPYEWALTQNRLGIAYNERIKGDKVDNLEKAIAAFEAALMERSREKLPYHWAETQSNLGSIYRIRIKGDSIENQEKAIVAYEAALQVYTREKLPFEWGRTQNNLGNSYRERTKGNKSENREKAIAAFEAALQVRTREKLPYEWALTQNNLGIAYKKRILGDRGENLEQAIASFEAVSQERTREKLPIDWAITQIELGDAYRLRINGEKAENVEKAIAAFESALLVCTREKLPYEWADIQNNLGITYVERKEGDQSENLQKAIFFYNKALEIWLPNVVPYKSLITAHLLGSLLYLMKKYGQAIAPLKTGHQALEIIRNEISVSSSKERLAADFNSLYPMLIACLAYDVDGVVQKKVYNEAFEYVCAAKGRSLAEKLGTQRPDIHKLTAENPALALAWNEISSIWQQIEENRMEIMELSKGKIQKDSDKNSLELVREKLLKKLDDLAAIRKNKLEDFTYQFPMLAATLTLPPVTGSAAQGLAAGLRCIMIEFYHLQSYHHQNSWVAFVITGSELKCIWLPNTANEAILETVDLIQSFESGLTAAYGTVIQKKVFQALHENLFTPLKDFLPENGSLLITPHDIMHYIPLSLAQDKDEQFLFEKYELSFMSGTTSANALYQQVMKEQAAKENINERLLMVVHSGQAHNKLNYTKTEAEAVESNFKNKTLLMEEKATPKAVIEAARQHLFSALHFSCHGGFDMNSPELSGLMLQSTLTVERILNELRIKNRPLVVMSACQTGRSKVGGGDELTGLNQALLQSGAGSIVSSLWSVNDESTMHLMKAFYEERMKYGTTNVMALRKAMQTVRTMPDYKSAFFWGAFQMYGLPGNISELFADLLESA